MRCVVPALLVLLGALACSAPAEEPESTWALAETSREHVDDPLLEERIFRALDAAESAGTDPSISHYHVRASTAFGHDGVEHTVVGGNSEYAGYPEAIHGETSLMNHVISTVGPEAARSEVGFLAFYTDRQCGGGGSCGDCRDYLVTTTNWKDLLMVCGQSSDHTVHVKRFEQWIVPEERFPAVEAEAIDLAPGELESLVEAAVEARAGGISLFTTAEEHLGVAVLTAEGGIHRAAGADDAAFHYRYAVGAALQQAATYRDYFVTAVVVVAAPGHTPRVSYRDRQYGYELSSFNAKRGLPPIQLIVVEQGVDDPAFRYRLTTFEEALPGAFSTASFMPEAVDRFLADRASD
jgi:cytidine deaminase